MIMHPNGSPIYAPTRPSSINRRCLAVLAACSGLVLACAATPGMAQTPDPTVTKIQIAPGAPAPDGSQPQMIFKSDKPLTPEEQAKLKAQFEALQKLPPANPLIPGFSLETPEGQKLTLSDLHGKVVLLDYWATWCAPCIEGLPELDAVYKKYRSNPNVAILAVNPLMGDTPETIQSYFKQKGFTVPVAYDRHFGKPASPEKTAKPVQSVVSLPVVLLLDRDGKQTWFSTGGEVGDATHAFQHQLIAKIDAQLQK